MNGAQELLLPPYFNFATHVMDAWARERPDGLALWYVDARSGSEKKLTFSEVSCLSRKLAGFLQKKGVRPGDRVLVMLPRVPEWWISILGLIRMGAVPVPATQLLTARDLGYRLELAKITAVIANPDGRTKLAGFDGLGFLACGEGEPCGKWHHLGHGLRSVHDDFPGTKTRACDPGIIYFTSATTGEPKMVLHTQASYGLGHWLTGKFWLDLKPGDVHWNISDLGWAKAAWSSFFGPWQMGACVFALDAPGKFDPAVTLDVLATFPISTWCAPPTALRLIIRQDLSRWRFPHLRHCVTAGEPLNPEVFNAWLSATGLMLYEAYGQTETVVLAGNFRCLNSRLRPGSMGKPTPGMEVAVIDDSNQVLPAGSEGEIAIRLRPRRPVGLFSEYWLNPDETARKFQGDWYLTGDRAVVDDEGYLWFVGRKDDVIKSSGYRIGPFEVESALLEHPAVLEVAVIGKPDPLRGQLVKAYIVLRPGFEGSDDLRIALQTHCKNLIAAYKYPREIEFVPDLPKTTSGKTRHKVLREAASTTSV